MNLYDYIYVDLEKVTSLYSQITGGVVELREATTESISTSDNKRKYDFKVFKHDAGGTDRDKSGLKELTKPHHSLLSELEDELARNGSLIDLSDTVNLRSLRDAEFRAQIKNTFCIKVTGRAVIEDYERIKLIAAVFPQIMEMINKSIESSLRSSPAFVALKSQIEQVEQENKLNKNSTMKAQASLRLKSLKQSLNDLVSSSIKVGTVDQWILDGLKTWINAFLPGIVNLRMYPSIERLDEHIFGHLKKQCSEDSDSNSFHFTYGSIPTEQMTMIGIITSVPEESGDAFKPLTEFQQAPLTNEQSVENAFRGVFRGFDGMEQMIRTCRYPRVLVYPLMVYRSVMSNPALPQTESTRG